MHLPTFVATAALVLSSLVIANPQPIVDEDRTNLFARELHDLVERMRSSFDKVRDICPQKEGDDTAWDLKNCGRGKAGLLCECFGKDEHDGEKGCACCIGG